MRKVVGFFLLMLGLGLGIAVEGLPAQSGDIMRSTRGFFNFSGPPVASSCGDGALQTGSTNSSGRVVGTTQTACTLTFSNTFGGNAADCQIENITANRGNVTASSSTAFTVSNLTAGDDFMYWCTGR